jgi:CDP-2,3-bis-(O-geranylgeranyl)-sn-glycerol synthase
LILLTVANGTPVVAKRLFGGAFAQPLDGGALFADGRPWFGPSKTIRGVVLATLATTAAAAALGLGWKVGALVGTIAMASDLLSSFVKRRLGLAPSSQAIGLDQIPESLLPLLAARLLLPLTVLDIAVTTLLFFVGELILSRLLYKWHLRDRPY